VIDLLLQLRFEEVEVALVKWQQSFAKPPAPDDEFRLSVYRALALLFKNVVVDVTTPEGEKVAEQWAAAVKVSFSLAKKRCPHCEDVINVRSFSLFKLLLLVYCALFISFRGHSELVARLDDEPQADDDGKHS